MLLVDSGASAGELARDRGELPPLVGVNIAALNPDVDDAEAILTLRLDAGPLPVIVN